MPNVKKKPDERRSEYLGVRLVPEQKRKLEKCARVRGISDSACSILEEQEERQRKWKYR